MEVGKGTVKGMEDVSVGGSESGRRGRGAVGALINKGADGCRGVRSKGVMSQSTTCYDGIIVPALATVLQLNTVFSRY